MRLVLQTVIYFFKSIDISNDSLEKESKSLNINYSGLLDVFHENENDVISQKKTEMNNMKDSYAKLNQRVNEKMNRNFIPQAQNIAGSIPNSVGAYGKLVKEVAKASEANSAIGNVVKAATQMTAIKK